MGIRIPNTNFDYNANLARDDEDEEKEFAPSNALPKKGEEVSTEGLSVFGDVSSRDGVFDLEIDPEKLETNLEDPKKPEKRDVAPEDLLKAMREGGGTLSAVTPERQPQYTSWKPTEEEEPKEEEPQGLFDDVTSIDARQERERQAFADELAARKAEEIQRTEARAGLGGMGLSGATSELVGDVARQAERAGDIAMADLGRRQQKETFDELRRQASIWTFEEEFGVDLNGDGKIGFGEKEEESGVPEGVLPPEAHANAPSSREGTVLEPIEDIKDAVAEFTGRGDPGEFTALPGHPDNPMTVGRQDLPRNAEYIGTDDEGYSVYVGLDGTYYRVEPAAEGFREWVQ